MQLQCAMQLQRNVDMFSTAYYAVHAPNDSCQSALTRKGTLCMISHWHCHVDNIGNVRL
jgi:hypothetical protein